MEPFSILLSRINFILRINRKMVPWFRGMLLWHVPASPVTLDAALASLSIRPSMASEGMRRSGLAIG